MKKFADRKSLESTQFANLQDLVMRVITFALDSRGSRQGTARRQSVPQK
jgi:hypothetical protein